MERDRAERAERAAATRDVPAPSVGIWGSAPQSLTWGNTGKSSKVLTFLFVFTFKKYCPE